MRVPPLPAGEWDDEARAALAGLVPRTRQNPEGAGLAMSVLVRNPGLAKAYIPFGTYTLTWSTLPARLRELVILRVARLRDCPYERIHHEKYAADLGVSEAEIRAAAQGKATDEATATALRAVDELEQSSDVTDDTWTALREHLDERQVMDLIFTIGCYSMVSMAFNVFGIGAQDDSHLAGND